MPLQVALARIVDSRIAAPVSQLIIGLFLCSVTALTTAEDNAPLEETFKQVWDHATLWQGRDDSYVALSGRLQVDAYRFTADSDDVPTGADDYADDTRWRRFRFGFLSEFDEGYTIQLEADFDLNNEPGQLYNRLTDAYIGYSPGNTWGIKVLKQSAGFTLDGATSSKKLLTLQRNALTNNLWATDEYFSGVQVSGEADKRWHYRAGLFSGDDSDEIGIDNVGYFSLLSLGNDFSGHTGWKEALVRLDYVYNSKDKDDQLDDNDDYDNNATPDFRHTLSFVAQLLQDGWGLRTDIAYGQGLDLQSDIWGVVVMPFYSFNEYHQLVTRYTFLDSSDDNGIRLGRYENELVSGKGDRYNEFYLGYNLFIYGQKLKWQTGMQYTDMQDDADDGGRYAGWGLTTGLRMYW